MHLPSYGPLQEAAKGRPMPGPSLVLAAENVLMALMWRLNGLEAEDSSPPSASAIASLGKAAAAFGNHLDHVAAAEESVPVHDAITRVQADFFLVFSAEKLKASHCSRHHSLYHNSLVGCKMLFACTVLSPIITSSLQQKFQN